MTYRTYAPSSKSPREGSSKNSAVVTPSLPWILIKTFALVPAFDSSEVATLISYTNGNECNKNVNIAKAYPFLVLVFL